MNVSLLSSQVASLPFRTDDVISSTYIVKVFLVTVLVLALLYLVLNVLKAKRVPWITTKRSTGNVEQRLLRLETTRLSPSACLHLIAVDKKCYLVTEHATGMSVTEINAVEPSSSALSGAST